MENVGIQDISMAQADEVGGGFLPLVLGVIDLALIAYDAYQISKL